MPTVTYKIVEDSVGSPGIVNDGSVDSINQHIRDTAFSSTAMPFGITNVTRLHRAFLRFNLGQPISGTPIDKQAFINGEIIVTRAYVRWRAPHDLTYVFNPGVKLVNPINIGESLPRFPSCPTLYMAWTTDPIHTGDPRYPRVLFNWGDEVEDVLAEILPTDADAVTVGPTTAYEWYELDVTRLVRDFLATEGYNPSDLTTRQVWLPPAVEGDPDIDGGLDYLYNNFCLRLDEGNAGDNIISGTQEVWYQRLTPCAIAEYGAELIIEFSAAPVTLTVNATYDTVSLANVTITVDDGTPQVTPNATFAVEVDVAHSVLAVAPSGPPTYRFVEWTANGSPLGSVNPISVTPSEDMSLVAIFEEIVPLKLKVMSPTVPSEVQIDDETPTFTPVTRSDMDHGPHSITVDGDVEYG